MAIQSDRNSLTVRDVQPGDVEALAETIRETDRREILATSGSLPLDAITRAVEQSDRVWCGVLNGEVMFVGGVSPANLGNRRAPWMIGSQVLDLNPAVFLRYCREKMPLVKEAFPYLENYVDERATDTVRWLKWLGFTVEPPVPYGVLRRPFHRFWYKAE